ncbi:YciI family protein [Micromonospora coerulea]|uniref:YciI family protein n=1 Tax=Micromonospora coerulea TaxID=47856 RepID=UPI0019076E64|nr:YciI family protein [Micromonospora veneta]
MTRYLISFGAGAMDHIPDEEMPDVGKASHAVVQEAVNAGVFVFGAGLERQRASVVATDGMVTDGPYPETKEVIGGFVVVDVASREEALAWAAKIAVACRCAQEVRQLMPDPKQTRCSARLTGDDDIPTTTDRGRPATLEQELRGRG